MELLAAINVVADGNRLLGETVRGLLDVIVPAFADVATLDALASAGEMRRLGVRVNGPDHERAEQMLGERHQSGDESVGVLRTAFHGDSQLLVPPDDALRRIASSDEDHELLRSLRLNATIYVPLRARGRILGVLACSTCAERAPLNEEDLRFAEVMAGRIGLALDNAGLSETVSGLERRLEVTLANLAAAVVVRDADGTLVFANQAAADMISDGSVEEMYAAPQFRAEIAHTEYTDENGEPVDPDDLPPVRALRGEHPQPTVLRAVRRDSGTARWLLYKSTPVDDDGELSLVVTVIEDITEQKRAERAARLLSEAGRELSASLDYEQTLQRVASLAVPDLADWCAVSMLAADDTHLEQVAVANRNPARVAFARAWSERYVTDINMPGAAADVIRTGRPLFVPELTDELLARVPLDEERLELVREIGMRSLVMVPLALPGQKPFGLLLILMAESGRLFTEWHLSVAEELGRRAATAVQNARLYTERSRVATVLQRSLLPPELPTIPGFEIASLYLPAGTDSEVGGDFYDAFEVPGGGS